MRRIEVELWFRDNGKSRAAAFRRVAEVVAEAGGRLAHRAVIEEIGYEAVLIDLPAAEIVPPWSSARKSISLFLTTSCSCGRNP